MNKKIISVHNHPCITKCQHADVCYFFNGKHEIENDNFLNMIPIDDAIDKITGEKEIHYSGCEFMASFLTYSGSILGNELEKSMTISYNHYKNMKELMNKDDFVQFKLNIQLTVYTLKQLQDPELKDVQKLFLVKDELSYGIAVKVFNNPDKYCNIHFPITQEWARDNPDQLPYLISIWNTSLNDTLSLDSCLENFLLNKKCIYSEDYIDLRYDDTVRRCPFSDECHKINHENPDEMFNIIFKPDCLWSELFREDIKSID